LCVIVHGLWNFQGLSFLSWFGVLGAGVNVKVVSEILGHADVAITLSIYGHVTPHMQQVALAVIEEVLGETPVSDE
jgi:integrase